MVRVVLLIVAIALVVLLARTVKDLDPKVRRRLGWWTFAAVGGVALVLLFVRFGFHWLVVAVAALLAFLGRAIPWLLRLLPFLGSVRRFRDEQRAAQGRAEAGSPPPSGGAPPPRRGRMSRAEALEVLGLREGATKEEIVRAYKELMKKVHPDKPDGSNYLATKLNEAKDTLLG